MHERGRRGVAPREGGEGAAAPGEGGEGGREGAAAGCFYNVLSLPSVGSRTIGKAGFAKCQITALGKLIFAECLGFGALGKYMIYFFISLFSITCFSFFVRCTLKIPCKIDSTIYI